MTAKSIVPVSWDSDTFGLPAFEITNPTEKTFKKISKKAGHYTVKVDPLSDKRLLHHHGFYYCDTLIQPFCHHKDFIFHADKKAELSKKPVAFKALEQISKQSYVYGRFHRDFNISKTQADRRYLRWLKELYDAGNVHSFFYQKKFAGYLAYQKNKILLHAISPQWRGKGISKYLWSLACKELFSQGHSALTSSISAANSAAVNLYASLGFKFGNAQDIYHKLV